MRVLVFLNEISPLSNSFELSVWIAEETDVEVVIASFYDSEADLVNSDVDVSELSVDIIPLGAESRFDLPVWLEFFKLVGREWFDLVHTHQNYTGSVARLLCALAGVPTVDTEHRSHESLSRLQNLVNSPTLPLAAGIVTNSRATRDSFRWYERLILDYDSVQVVHNGVDIDEIDSAETTNDRTTGFEVICVARLIPVKDHATLIRGFNAVREDFPDSRLTLVGDGPCSEPLKELADNLSLSRAIRFTGQLPRRRVYELLWESDVFAITSISEGFCVAAVEAMAAGLPVVASDIPIFHEVLGSIGTFFEPGKPQDLGEAIGGLLRDQSRRERLLLMAASRSLLL